MDILQIALIFLIVLLGIFLSITGTQVFLILRDLKKTLDKNRPQVSEPPAQQIVQPVHQNPINRHRSTSHPRTHPSRRLFRKTR